MYMYLCIDRFFELSKRETKLDKTDQSQGLFEKVSYFRSVLSVTLVAKQNGPIRKPPWKGTGQLAVKEGIRSFRPKVD